MIHLKNLISKNSENINIIVEGLQQLEINTHLVGQQINDNLSEYIENFDDQRFTNKIGQLNKFLGAGVFGSVYSLSNKKVLTLI